MSGPSRCATGCFTAPNATSPQPRRAGDTAPAVVPRPYCNCWNGAHAFNVTSASYFRPAPESRFVSPHPELRLPAALRQLFMGGPCVSNSAGGENAD